MILASRSPRRRELLSLFAEDFRIIPAEGEEIIPEGTSPKDAVLILSRQKAEEISARFTDDVIISADTVVSIDGEILGKPRSPEEAVQMLTKLSGREHYVYTGVCVIFPDGSTVNFAEETTVEFHPLTSKEILDYVSTGEPMDKAGAYGIQGKGALLVKRIDGDYYNVMGLPVGRLYREIRQHGERL